MGDVEGAGLVIYNAHTSKLCRVESDFMKSTNHTFIFEEQKHMLNDTIFGLSIIGKGKYLIFHSKKRRLFIIFTYYIT